MADAPTYAVHHKRAEELLAELPDNSVDLILTDPPYYKVKTAAWDNQWRTPQEFLAWMGTILEEYKRVLKPNGSLYVFASPQMAGRVEALVWNYFNVLCPVVWRKPEDNGERRHVAQIVDKGLERNWYPGTERIIFAEHYGADNIAKGEAGYGAKCDELRGFVFEPLRAYFAAEKERCGISSQQVQDGMFRLTGKRYVFERHTFSRSQWELPTQEQYEAARRLFCEVGGGEYLTREYEDLRQQYEDLRQQYEDLRQQYEDLRRYFSVDATVPYTDVWDFPTVAHYPGKHECEKPQPLLQHIIKASSRPGAVVLDTFCGGGSTGEAVITVGEGRRVILCDASEHWAGEARRRCEAVADGRPFRPVRAQKKPNESRNQPQGGQVRLFDLPSWETVAG